MPPKGRGRGKKAGVGVKKPGEPQPEHAARGPPAAQKQEPAAAQPAAPARRQPAEAVARPPVAAAAVEPEELAAPPVEEIPPPAEPAKPIASTSKELIKITSGIQRLGSEYATSDNMPKKKPPGTLGRKIQLIANHFPLTLPEGFVYHYDVDIEPVRKGAAPTGKPTKKGPPTGRKLNANLCRRVMDKLMSTNPLFRGHLPAYDGHKNIITRKALNLKKLEVLVVDLVEENEKISQFKVAIQPVMKEETGSCAISLTPLHAIMQGHRVDFPQEAIMALDIVMRHGPALKQVAIRRSFYNPPRNPKDAPYLGLGREVWFGYYQSLRPGQWKPMLNINKSATAFFSAQSVLEFIGDLVGRNPEALVSLDVRDIAKVSKELRNVQIEVTHLAYPRKHRFLRLTQHRASQLSFPMKKPDGREESITVDRYFKETYKRVLHFPNLPCIQVQPEDKKIFLPIEVCRIVSGQQSRKKLTDKQTSEMIKFTATPPADRFRDIQYSVQSTVEASRPYMREFGINVSTKPLELDGRVIQPPSVLYQNNQTTLPSNGAWDLRNRKFLTGATVKSWIVMNFGGGNFCKPFNVQKFVELLCQLSREHGMSMPPPLDKLECGADRRPIGVIMKEVKRKYPDLSLAIIILGRNSVYADIKHAAEIKEGIQTQCIKDENVVKKCNPQLVVNLLQKINAKVEGVNCSLLPQEKPSIFRKPIIIFGADVTHPAPGDKLKPSVAAVVASVDSYPCRYAVSIRVQKNRDKEENKPLEIIEKLEEMVRELLMTFYRRTKYKPEKIIFYRDGVSEGQFAQVQEKEISKLRQACSSLNKDYQPAITFIVVQKRHHTRFMPVDPRNGVGKHKNIPPGTTVDTDVVNPLNFDFFLCSHAGIQGTSRPAHYTVLWDDNDFTADELHKLTFHLCHTYVRCTRSISIPAPVMYAHLAAFRARNHIISGTDASSSSSESSEESMDTLTEDILNSVIVTQTLQERMYFV